MGTPRSGADLCSPERTASSVSPLRALSLAKLWLLLGHLGNPSPVCLPEGALGFMGKACMAVYWIYLDVEVNILTLRLLPVLVF